MSDDDMVTLEVRMTEEQVRGYAEPYISGPVTDAARRWVAAHDRPERRRLQVWGGRPLDRWVNVCAVEDLQPGDRVAGREVESNIPGEYRGRLVQFDGDGPAAFYAPGSLVVLGEAP